MLKRGAHGVWQAVRTIPECSDFPWALAGALFERVATWLRPMYGCRSEAEELGILSDEALQGALGFTISGCRFAVQGAVAHVTGQRSYGGLAGEAVLHADTAC